MTPDRYRTSYAVESKGEQYRTLYAESAVTAVAPCFLYANRAVRPAAHFHYLYNTDLWDYVVTNNTNISNGS